MIAAAEIFGIPIFIIFVIVYFLAKLGESVAQNANPQVQASTNEKSNQEDDEYEGDNEEEYWTGVALNGYTFLAPAAAGPCAGLVKELIVQGKGYTVAQDRATEQRFLRGNFSIKRMPGACVLGWREFPVSLSVTYRVVGLNTAVQLSWIAPPDTKFGKASAEYFHKAAKREALELEQETIGILGIARASSNPKHTEYYSSDWAYAEGENRKGVNEDASENDDDDNDEYYDEDEEDTCENEVDDSDNFRSDFEELGLKPDAQWEEVKTAYRQICRKFHPDTFESLNLPSHLAELASLKFQRATQAYHNLREGWFGATK